MQFLKKLLFNISLYAVATVVLYLIFPEMMGAVYQFLWMVFGPLVFLMFIPAVLPALPKKRRRN